MPLAITGTEAWYLKRAGALIETPSLSFASLMDRILRCSPIALKHEFQPPLSQGVAAHLVHVDGSVCTRLFDGQYVHEVPENFDEPDPNLLFRIVDDGSARRDDQSLSIEDIWGFVKEEAMSIGKSVMHPKPESGNALPGLLSPALETPLPGDVDFDDALEKPLDHIRL